MAQGIAARNKPPTINDGIFVGYADNTAHICFEDSRLMSDERTLIYSATGLSECPQRLNVTTSLKYTKSIAPSKKVASAKFDNK